MTATTTRPGMPLTNAQIAARNAELAERAGTNRPIPPVLMSYTIGSRQVVWTKDARQDAEVRDSQGRVVFAGSKDECFAFARSR